MNHPRSSIIRPKENHASSLLLEVNLNLRGSVGQTSDLGGDRAPHILYSLLFGNIAEGLPHRGEDADHTLAGLGVDLLVALKARAGHTALDGGLGGDVVSDLLVAGQDLPEAGAALGRHPRKIAPDAVLAQDERGQVDILGLDGIVGKVVGEEQHRGDPLIEGQGCAGEPGAGGAGVDEDVAPEGIGVDGNAVALVVGAVVDEEILPHRQESQAHAAVALGDVEVHNDVGAGGADPVHDLFHVDPHAEGVGIGPLLGSVLGGAVEVVGGVTAVLTHRVPFEVGHTQLAGETDEGIRQLLPVVADQAHIIAFLGLPDGMGIVDLAVPLDLAVGTVGQGFTGDGGMGRADPEAQLHAVAVQARLDRPHAIGEAGEVNQPVAALLIPARVDDEDLNAHLVGGVDLGEHPLLVHVHEVAPLVPEAVALLEAPAVVEDVGLAALAVEGIVLELELAEGGGQGVGISLYHAEVQPDRLKAILIRDGTRQVVALLGREGDPSVGGKTELHEGVGILGAMLVGEEVAVMAVGARQERAHGGEAVGEGGVLDGDLVHAEAVEHFVELGKAHLGEAMVGGDREGTVVQPLACRLGQLVGAVTQQDVLEFDHGRGVGHAEEETEGQGGGGLVGQVEGILGDRVVAFLLIGLFHRRKGGEERGAVHLEDGTYEVAGGGGGPVGQKGGLTAEGEGIAGGLYSLHSLTPLPFSSLNIVFLHEQSDPGFQSPLH